MKPTLISGIKPSGDLQLGNYIGAISQWLTMQKDYRCFFCLVDYHAITVYQKPAELRQRSLDIIRAYLALGIDPKKSIIFKQSDVPEHTELGWILNTLTKVSELEKMTQYKDYVRSEKKEGPGAGLLNYPTLMAADILLYQTDVVPVGEDQIQHIELTRLLAKRFNSLYGETFTVPKGLLKSDGARIMQLNDPTKKMSKSIPAGCIFLNDKPTEAHKKIKRAVTDSDNRIYFDEKKKPAISNLLSIYSAVANVSLKELELRYEGKSYGEFKEDLANTVANFLEDFQERYEAFDEDEVRKILHDGGFEARALAEATMKKVKRNLGLQ